MERTLGEHLRHLELSLLQPTVRADAAQLAALLADDFREFGSSGRVYDRPRIIELLATEPTTQLVSDLSIADFETIQLSENTALVTYRIANTHRISQSLRSSIWVLRDDHWQMLFHQGTCIP